ncbi:non-structural maintenance of chromosomes element 1 homolog isoform X2 [Misgurnus anguillicaudatus]|uniref:non-structural maintenance of chromosomes element 1 homolog isoform X2 n=1 Tax=Misgurnus anguillicaudatus TaxID=75329 RepID=UPI003CCF85C3
MPMGDSHRRFLQSIMGYGIISASQAKALHRHCCEAHGAHYAQDRLEEFIEVINSHLQPMFMNIRKGMSEEDGLQYYAMVNMAQTFITRMSSDYADNELELFRKTMDFIVESETGSASSTDIINCADSLQTKKLKKKEAEHVLTMFVQDKWLIEGQVCERPGCGIKMHLPCVARYFKGRTDPRCPTCNDFWPHEIPEIPRSQSQGSQSLASAKENTAPTPSTSATRRSRRS